MDIHLQSETKVLIASIQIKYNYNQFNLKTFLLPKMLQLSLSSQLMCAILILYICHRAS